MSLPSSPPASLKISFRRGDEGWGVYALQSYANYVVSTSSLILDGVFGSKTDAFVRLFQKTNNLAVDGIAGPATQRKLILGAITKAEKSTGLPAGLARGLIETESGFKLAEVNWYTPPGGTKGVDCGTTQRRVYGPPFSHQALKDAFGVRAITRAVEEVKSRINFFVVDPWVKGIRERAGRLAVFAHNWPYQGGADYYAIHGHVSNPNGSCSWLPRNSRGQLYVKFPDGALVVTRQDWAEFIAMGGKHGESRYCRYVTSW